MSALEIYTDGSSAPHPRTGGVGFLMIFPDGTDKTFMPWGYKGASSNEMELQACILALREALKLKDLKGADSIVIYSDSQYVVGNIYNAKFVWPKNKWVRESGGPVLNASLWKDLIRAILGISRKFRCTVYFEKIKGHSGNPGNDAVDKLAKKSRSTPFSNKLSSTNVRRKLTSEKITIGSVKGEGQKIRIRIITSRWLKQQKLYRSAFEVISKGSKYYKKADYLLADKPMRGGHIFDVRLAQDANNCRIEKVFREIKKN